MFGLSNIRLIAYGVILLVIVGAVAHDKYLSNRLKAKSAQAAELVTERDQAKADFTAYKQAKEADATLNRSTSETVQNRNTSIERTRTDVRVQCRPASVPGTSTSSGTAAGANAAPIDGGATTPLRDIGSALEDARIEALKNNSNYIGLQEWEKRRR